MENKEEIIRQKLNQAAKLDSIVFLPIIIGPLILVLILLLILGVSEEVAYVNFWLESITKDLPPFLGLLVGLVIAFSPSLVTCIFFLILWPWFFRKIKKQRILKKWEAERLHKVEDRPLAIQRQEKRYQENIKKLEKKITKERAAHTKTLSRIKQEYNDAQVELPIIQRLRAELN